MKSSPSESVAGKRALIFYHCFVTSVGGGPYLPLLLICELQRRGYFVTLALNRESYLEHAKKFFHVDFDTQKVNMVIISPRNEFLKSWDYKRPFYRPWQLKKLAKDADICISTSTIMDFGKPAHYFISSRRSFWEAAFLKYVRHISPSKGFASRVRRIWIFFVDTFFRPLIGVRATRKIVSDPRNHVYPNSQYINTLAHEFYGSFTGNVFYPPTMFKVTMKDVKRNPLQINYVGRIHPEKHLEDIINIVELARDLSGLDLTLHIAGYLYENSYVTMLKQTAKEKKWIQLVGPVYGEAKERFLLSGTYAVHAERDEAFGISVTEYLKAGCIPIVPDEGGTVEVVDSPALTYHTNKDAALILAKLLQDEAFRKEQLAHCQERAKDFAMEIYMEKQRLLLDRILSKET